MPVQKSAKSPKSASGTPAKAASKAATTVKAAAKAPAKAAPVKAAAAAPKAAPKVKTVSTPKTAAELKKAADELLKKKPARAKAAAAEPEADAEGRRETDEEAGAQIEMGPLFSLLNVRRVGQVHLFYRATLLSDQFNPGFETIEARLFAEDEVPWDELAFRTVKETLERYFADRKAGSFGLHCIDIE